MLDSVSKSVKHTALRFAALTGIEDVLRDSTWRSNRLLILCYHGLSLSDEHLWSNLYVTPDHLAERLRVLEETGSTIVPFGDGVRRLYEGSLPPRSVAVTFDDGFADFYFKAYPLLREFGTPSVVYLSTYYVTDQRPVFDPLVSYLLWKGQGRQLRLQGPLDKTVEIPRAVGPRIRLVKMILNHARKVGWSAEEKDKVADDLSAQIRFDLDALRARRSFFLMSQSEVAELDPDLIDIQLHTHRHRTPRDETRFVAEVVDNRRAIRELMPDRPVPTHFCYPSGDYDRMFIPWLRNEGVVSATTCDTGMASRRADPLLLPRLIDTMHLPDFVFRSWLAGTADLVPRRSA